MLTLTAVQIGLDTKERIFLHSVCVMRSLHYATCVCPDGSKGKLPGARSDLVVNLHLGGHRGSCLLGCSGLRLRVRGGGRGLIGVGVLLLRLGNVLIHLHIQPANMNNLLLNHHRRIKLVRKTPGQESFQKTLLCIPQKRIFCG